MLRAAASSMTQRRASDRLAGRCAAAAMPPSPLAKRRKTTAAAQDAPPSIDDKKRCFWGQSDALYRRYHDEEWGRPVHDERMLFEMLCLEGAQAGLSWLTILKKRDNYRRVFHNFEIDRVARMTDAELEDILAEEDVTRAVVRHRGKVLSVRANAQLAQALVKEEGISSFSDYLWSFAPASPHTEAHKASNPTKTPESEALSKALKKRGFKFVGPTIVYAFMQATGMVDDHMPTCFLYKPEPKGQGQE